MFLHDGPHSLDLDNHATLDEEIGKEVADEPSAVVNAYTGFQTS